ncbi:MAG: thioredoxin family protein [Aquabacterium sp.]|jgi:thiol-disulfide isomerase/thioredoxin|uniref:thioredoxin family protein n=1 Tax=Aquabacterium sp. TaxID=1872578 RepID=UPI002A363381|nr:thioredoxin family protein [Aquabacterium sp.]MDX9843211.1 thioredoxin family protein [Aquabacterium sp.]
MVDSPVLDIVCLCADWCGTCREYAGVFEALQQVLPAHHYRWIDIEDEADALGDIDIETFPTLLVAHAGRVLFAGPVLPRLGDAQRLIEVQTEVAQRQAWPSLVSLGVPADQQTAYTQLAQALHAARG